jgi:predicted RNA-binding Zn ribbon-like protein
MRGTATGRVLTDPRGRSFRFDAGALCLDFAHAGGEGEYAVFEILHEPADLEAWLAEPPLSLELSTPATSRDLTAAKKLRQAIWVAAHARADGVPIPADAIEALNGAAAAPPLAPSLDAGGTTTTWAPPVRVTQALSTIAREMIDLVSGPLGDRIRECASGTCPLVFVDSSRPNARRWCAMERCGNRHKLEALRARRSAGP